MRKYVGVWIDKEKAKKFPVLLSALQLFLSVGLSEKIEKGACKLFKIL